MHSLFRIAGHLRPHASRSLRQSRIPSTFSQSSNPSIAVRNGSSRGPLCKIPLRRAFSNQRYSSPDTTKANNYVLYGFMGVNLGVYGLFHYRKWLVETGQDPTALRRHYQEFTLSLQNFLGGSWWTAVTCTFSHTGVMHILGNMMSAYYLGKLVTMTPSVRPFQIVGLVLGSGICGSLGWLYQQYYRARKSGVIAQRHGLGFSGSVMGLGVVAAMMYPTTTMLIYGIVPVPLWALVGGYFAYDAYYLQQNNTGVAHAGHVGGFAFGVLYYFLSIRRGIWARPRF